MALVKPPEWTIDQLFRGRPLVVVLDGVQDPGNAGAIVRAAEAFGATGALFLKGGQPVQPQDAAGSAGSLFRLPFLAAVSRRWPAPPCASTASSSMPACPRAALPCARWPIWT